MNEVQKAQLVQEIIAKNFTPWKYSEEDLCETLALELMLNGRTFTYSGNALHVACCLDDGKTMRAVIWALGTQIAVAATTYDSRGNTPLHTVGGTGSLVTLAAFITALGADAYNISNIPNGTHKTAWNLAKEPNKSLLFTLATRTNEAMIFAKIHVFLWELLSGKIKLAETEVNFCRQYIKNLTDQLLKYYPQVPCLEKALNPKHPLGRIFKHSTDMLGAPRTDNTHVFSFVETIRERRNLLLAGNTMQPLTLK